MKIAVLSDIHANLEALEATLLDAEKKGAARVLCLGDIVGYGPDPLGCIYRLREVGAQLLMGNHDEAVLDPRQVRSFNVLARSSLLHAAQIMGEEEQKYLRQAAFSLCEGEAVLCHAHPIAPRQWEPLFLYDSICRCMEALPQKMAFVGHTHHAGIYCKTHSQPLPLTSATVAIGPHQYLINPGSVGQPRDGDWRASYALWDRDGHYVELQRVEYPLERTQKKIIDLSYPVYEAERLAKGE